MYKIGDYLVYKHDVCIVKDIKDTTYVISPIDDKSLIINTPIDNQMNFIRDVISKEYANTLIEEIKNIKPLDNIDEKNLELKYKELLQDYSHENLVKIIKTTYIRNEIRLNNNKKISEKDHNYFSLAEKYLYNELAISLNKTVEEIKELIIRKCTENT